jgi:hypothetical protein
MELLERVQAPDGCRKLPLLVQPGAPRVASKYNYMTMTIDSKLEFKFVIVKDDSVIQWETLPQNRKYRARYCRVVLKADWNSQEGREVVEKKFKSSMQLNEGSVCCIYIVATLKSLRR